jgi:3D-(3,5/4)-trihydroxycyclohexane-1,2-dione acylhydrolase (decyclizing)
VTNLAELNTAVEQAREEKRSTVIVIATDPAASTSAGGAWWDVAIPETPSRAETTNALATYRAGRARQRVFY